jgi:acyl-CoA hydrolase
MNPQFKTVEKSMVTLTELMLPSHSNFSGKIHGGYILNLMDQIAFACAAKHSGNYCVTASVNRVDFINPIDVGDLVTLKASINYTGNSSMIVGVRVESEKIQTGEVKHCNSSYFTMVSKNLEGKSVKVPGIILDKEERVRRFVRSIQRMEETHARRKKFTETSFKLEDFVDLLKDKNAKLDI